MLEKKEDFIDGRTPAFSDTRACTFDAALVYYYACSYASSWRRRQATGHRQRQVRCATQSSRGQPGGPSEAEARLSRCGLPHTCWLSAGTSHGSNRPNRCLSCCYCQLFAPGFTSLQNRCLAHIPFRSARKTEYHTFSSCTTTTIPPFSIRLLHQNLKDITIIISVPFIQVTQAAVHERWPCRLHHTVVKETLDTSVSSFCWEG